MARFCSADNPLKSGCSDKSVLIIDRTSKGNCSGLMRWSIIIFRASVMAFLMIGSMMYLTFLGSMSVVGSKPEGGLPCGRSGERPFSLRRLEDSETAPCQDCGLGLGGERCSGGLP